ncbi:unnamed protein product, partial [marine sediment metagenome]
TYRDADSGRRRKTEILFDGKGGVGFIERFCKKKVPDTS